MANVSSGAGPAFRGNARRDAGVVWRAFRRIARATPFWRVPLYLVIHLTIAAKMRAAQPAAEAVALAR
jgi:hypothetical protein